MEPWWCGTDSLLEIKHHLLVWQRYPGTEMWHHGFDFISEVNIFSLDTFIYYFSLYSIILFKTIFIRFWPYGCGCMWWTNIGIHPQWKNKCRKTPSLHPPERQHFFYTCRCFKDEMRAPRWDESTGREQELTIFKHNLKDEQTSNILHFPQSIRDITC